ncbi:hypothetical protein ZOSMA_172G00350 [Zostera marina]|uniref:Malectin-like domain-containing protein n=1 Tax=Zostera marina TaxID=29655 RepID=A0A0K9PSE3_ZOSMR|nr:hypothetical protein ZOSMA_172G00350 [Zostera marina]
MVRGFSEFISINCGQENDYVDNATDLTYISDSSFVESGMKQKDS